VLRPLYGPSGVGKLGEGETLTISGFIEPQLSSMTAGDIASFSGTGKNAEFQLSVGPVFSDVVISELQPAVDFWLSQCSEVGAEATVESISSGRSTAPPVRR